MTKDKEYCQTISINGNVNDGQLGNAVGDLNQLHIIQNRIPENQISIKEMIQFVEQMQCILNDSALPQTPKSECIKHLKIFKDQIDKKNPNKDLAAYSLNNLTHILKEIPTHFETGSNVMNHLQPLITKMLPWLGESKKFLVL